ncbi:MAG: transcriptional regulator [Flavobacterium sp.]|nr:transcriptional regulator [Flavobacterium sp.]
MNYIKHLTGFFDRAVKDRHLNPTHISLYIGLFQFWNVNRFQNPISITRDEIMRISKICSKATYHKCMKELNDKGYIKYEPSFNPFKGSMVILFDFSDDLKPATKKTASSSKIDSVTEQAVNKLCTSSETGTEHVIGTFYKHNINNTNFTNIENVQTSENFLKNENNFLQSENHEKEKKLRQKKKSFCEPVLNEVKQFFKQNNFPELEAQKFFNYFSSNGWLVGGKTPMVDWQAAAQNWMLNFDKFNTTEPITKTNHLTTTTDKNYAEPL